MDLQAFGKIVRAAEAMTLEAGPCAGLTLEQVLDAVPDAGNNVSTVIRGRSQSALVGKAYLRMYKAQEELAVALGQAAAKPVTRAPRNSKMSFSNIPTAETLAIVPFVEPASSGDSRAEIQLAQKPCSAQFSPARLPTAQWRFRRFFTWAFLRRWSAWLVGSVITMCLPKLVMQLVGLCMKLFVKHSVIAVSNVAAQAVEEIGGAGQLLVVALEEALDIPAALASSAPPPAQSFSTSLAATAILKDIVGEGNATILGPLLQQAFEAQQPVPPAQSPVNQWQLPGWLLVVAGGIGTRMLG